MNLPHQRSSIGFQQVEDDEGGTTRNNLNISKLSQRSTQEPSRKKTSRTNWKKMLYLAIIALILGVIFYCVLDVSLKVERSKSKQLQATVKEQSEALKEEKSKSAELQVTVKDQYQALKEERSKSGELSARVQEHSEKIAQKQKLIDGLTSEVSLLQNSLKASSSEKEKLKAELSAKPGQKAAFKDSPDNPHVVVDIEYASEGYAPLPINPLRTNGEGKRIEDALYKNEATRKKRMEFMQQRFQFVDGYTNLISLNLAKYNLINSEEQLKKASIDNQQQWLRLEAKFRLSKVKEELAMCVVVPGFNNNANFRIEYNLNSIFTQNYSNYRVVIVNDASTDGGDQVYRNFFSFYAIDKQRYTYIENSKRVTALQNIYIASINHCRKDSIVVTLDGDDEFIGRNVLQVFNWAYQSMKAGVIYSNFYWFQQPQKAWQGFTLEYTNQQKKSRLYRNVYQKFSQLRSWRAELVHQIDPKDLKDQKGSFFNIAYDMNLMFPLMQLSCARVHKIQGEFHYLYNRGTGLNDDVVAGGRQIDVDRLVRQRKKYDCFKEFDDRMNKLPAISFNQPIAKDNYANRIVDIEYASKEYGPLPINPMRKDAAGRKIEDVLFKDEATKKKRGEFIQQRANFVNVNSHFSSLLLSKYNLINSDQQLKKAIEDNQKDWSRLEAKFRLSKIKEELPMCILVPTFNNNARFRIQSNLNSIFTQNYTNYKVVVINDASRDNSDEIFRNFFSFHAIDKQRYTYIENVWRVYCLQNIYYASMNHCSKDSVVLIVSGDDELIGRNILQVFNWAYQTKKAGVVYSNFYKFQQPSSVEQGWTSEYPQDVKKGNLYRTSSGYSQLRTFRNQLIFKIKIKDLKTETGFFFTVAYDYPLFMALMEMSCGRVHKIEGEIHYLYNLNTGMNDNYRSQSEVVNVVREQKKYECLKDFDERMMK